MTTPYRRTTVPVAGGELTVGRWGTGDTVVVASHGITANHLSFAFVAEAVVARSGGDVSVVAVDHRGRAGSATTPGPFGLAAHADDVVSVMAAFGVDGGVLLGHSLGGFIVATAAERHPQQVARIVMIDGGVPFPSDGPPIDPSPEMIEAAVQAVIGPALDRLDQRWDTEDDYVDFFRAHPAFQPPNEWTAAVENYVRYDAVVTDDGRIRSSVAKEAVLVDGGAAIVDPAAAAAIERLEQPADWIWCPRGLLDQTPGLYPPGHVAATAARFGHLNPVSVPDTNHYTIVTTEHGADVVADTVLAALSVG